MVFSCVDWFRFLKRRRLTRLAVFFFTNKLKVTILSMEACGDAFYVFFYRDDFETCGLDLTYFYTLFLNMMLGYICNKFKVMG